MASFKVRTRARALSPSSPARATPSPQDAIPSARARDERRVEARLAALREAAALRAAAAEEEASPEPVATLEVAPLPDHHARRPLLAVDTLHAAATRGDVEGLGFLIAERRDVDATDALGCTPLWLAAAHGHVGAVRALVAAGADTGRPIAQTPAEAACSETYDKTNLVEIRKALA